jgi:hypothetical protein
MNRLLKIRGRGLRRGIHAQVDQGRTAEPARQALSLELFPDEASTPGLGIDQPASPRLVERPRNSGQIDV